MDNMKKFAAAAKAKAAAVKDSAQTKVSELRANKAGGGGASAAPAHEVRTVRTASMSTSSDALASNALERCVAALESERTRAQEAEAAVEALERARDALNRELQRAAAEEANMREAMNNALEEREMIRTRASEAWSEMSAKIEGLNAELEVQRAKAQLQGSGQTHVAALENVIEEERQTSAQKEKNLLEKIAQLEERLAFADEANEANDKLASNIQTLQTKLDAVQVELAAKMTEVKDLEQSKESSTRDLQDELARVKQSAQVAEATSASLESHVNSLKAEIEEKSKALEIASAESIKSNIDELEATLAQAQASVVSLQSELQVKIEALTVAEASASGFKNELESVRESLESQLLAAQQQVQMKTEALDAKTEALELAQSSVASTNVEREVTQQVLESELAKVQSELHAKSEALQIAESALSTTISEKEISQAALESQVADLNAQLNVAKEALEAKIEAFERAEALAASAEEITNVRQTYENQIAVLDLEMQEKQNAMERAEASCESMSQELESVRTSLQAQCAALRGELQVQIEALAAQTEALEHAEALSANAIESGSVRETLENQLAMVQTELQSKSEALLQAEQVCTIATQNADAARAALESQVATLQAALAEKSQELEGAVASTSSIHEIEAKLVQALDAVQASDAAKQTLESQVATLQAEIQDKAQLTGRYDELQGVNSTLESSLREANERLDALRDEIKQAAEKDASAAEALALAEKDAAKAKDNVASIASASATQFAQERQMMKNALGELQSERDILVKMLKTFHQHGNIHSTSVSQNIEESSSPGDSFMRRFTDSPSIASVFTPRKPPPPPPSSP